MNKREMIRMIKNLGLNKPGCIICMGSALMIHGLRQETHDIDVAVSDAVFKEYLKKGYQIDENISRERILIIKDGIEIELFRDLVTDIECEKINGVYVQTLESIIKWKTKLGRDKDKKDIEVIKDFINKNK